MDWLFEARRDPKRWFPWISIPGVASIRAMVRPNMVKPSRSYSNFGRYYSKDLFWGLYEATIFDHWINGLAVGIDASFTECECQRGFVAAIRFPNLLCGENDILHIVSYIP